MILTFQLKEIEAKLQKSTDELGEAKAKMEKNKSEAASRIGLLESQLAQKDKQASTL